MPLVAATVTVAPAAAGATYGAVEWGTAATLYGGIRGSQIAYQGANYLARQGAAQYYTAQGVGKYGSAYAIGTGLFGFGEGFFTEYNGEVPDSTFNPFTTPYEMGKAAGTATGSIYDCVANGDCPP